LFLLPQGFFLRLLQWSSVGLGNTNYLILDTPIHTSSRIFGKFKTFRETEAKRVEKKRTCPDCERNMILYWRLKNKDSDWQEGGGGGE